MVNKKCLSFKNIYSNINDIQIGFILLITILITYFGYILKEDSENNDRNTCFNKFKKYIGIFFIIIYGMLTFLIVYLILINLPTFFKINHRYKQYS